MLKSFYIENFIVLEKILLEFEQGFSVITGESGTGKTLLLQALSLVLGAKSQKEIIKNEQNIILIASFDISNNNHAQNYLKKINITNLDQNCILKRVINNKNVSTFYINEMPTTKVTLKKLASYLLQMQFQDAKFSLLDNKNHLDILDNTFTNNSLKKEIRDLFLKYQQLKEKLEEQKKAQSNNQLEYLNYQIKELEELKLNKNTFYELENKLKAQTNLKKINQLYTEFLEQVTNSKYEMQNIIKQIEFNKELDNKFVLLNEVITKAEIELEEAKEIIQSSFIESFEPSLQEKLDQKISSIIQIAKKHNIAPNNLHELLAKFIAQKENLFSSLANQNKIKTQYDKCISLYLKKSNELSLKRQAQAKILAKNIEKSLVQLNIKDAVFKIQIQQDQNQITKNGIDQVCFLIATNPNQKPQEITKIVSGGELSRLKLSLDIFVHNQFSCLVFDEIDTGLSGQTASNLALKLKKLAKNNQVICVTHLAQVASVANQGILVTKKDKKTKIKTLTKEERILEIARLLSAKEVTIQAKEQAKKLLDF